MSGALLNISRLIACLLAAWQPSSALAGDEDTQFWLIATARGDIAPQTTLTVDVSTRWREEARGDEQQTLRFSLDREVIESARIGGGAGVFEAGGATEIRLHQQAALSFGRFATRTRIEQRFFDGADRIEVRLRQRVRYNQPLGKSLTAGVEGEYLHLLQTRTRGADLPQGQWRGRLLLEAQVAPRLTLGGAYLVIHTPREDRADQINHVPQALIQWNF